MNYFGQKVKQIRENKNLTLSDISEISGISTAQLSRIETGKRGIPKPNTIKSLAKALDIDYSELMAYAGYTHNENSKEIVSEWYDSNLELKGWYDNLLNMKEEDVVKLKSVWDIFNKD